MAERFWGTPPRPANEMGGLPFIGWTEDLDEGEIAFCRAVQRATESKWCPRCHRLRDRKDFGPGKGRYDGRASRCLSCERDIARMKQGYKGGPRPDRLAHIYRLFDSSGRLLYIGKTVLPWVRFYAPIGSPTSPSGSHSTTKSWWPDVAVVRMSTYPDEDTALNAEAWAIRTERPLHNRTIPATTGPRPRPIHEIEGAPL